MKLAVLLHLALQAGEIQFKLFVYFTHLKELLLEHLPALIGLLKFTLERYFAPSDLGKFFLAFDILVTYFLEPLFDDIQPC